MTHSVPRKRPLTARSAEDDPLSPTEIKKRDEEFGIVYPETSHDIGNDCAVVNGKKEHAMSKSYSAISNTSLTNVVLVLGEIGLKSFFRVLRYITLNADTNGVLRSSDARMSDCIGIDRKYVRAAVQTLIDSNMLEVRKVANKQREYILNPRFICVSGRGQANTYSEYYKYDPVASVERQRPRPPRVATILRYYGDPAARNYTAALNACTTTSEVKAVDG